MITLCLLLASGQMSSIDGGSQLAQALHFCVTGNIGSSHRIDHDFAPKDFRVKTGVWYDANDIGATLLVLPAACAAAASGAEDPTTLAQLSPDAKAGASLTFALLGGIAIAFVFLSLSELLAERSRAWWWSLVFLFGTGFLAYVNGVWNVLPAATFVAVLAWFVIRCRLQRASPTRCVYGAAAAVGAAGLCRYTLLPFLTIAAIAALLPTLRSLPRRHLAGAALLLFVFVLPTFAYNQLRTGIFWRPGQAAPEFPSNNELHLGVSYWLGTTRMFFGFTHGLLFCAPICLLAYFGALLYIRRSSGWRRAAWIVSLCSAVAYVALVCLTHGWAANLAWGPRYIVPLFPVLFLAGVATIEQGLIPRALGYAIAAFGVLIQLPLMLVDWSAVVAAVGKDPRAPDPIVGVWESAFHGIVHGSGIGIASSAEALQVPDVWWWHVVAKYAPSPVGLLALVCGMAILLFVANTPTRRPSRAAPRVQRARQQP
ncbi:MAG: hypothetical protein ACRDJX_00670 [Solirubrobacteraceae bacterium]